MNKVLTLLLSIFLLLTPIAAEQLPAFMKDRNIILIVVCTLRADHLPFYGYTKNTAPFLADIAAQSVVFENAFSTSAWTAPSTASIHSGVYPFQHGVISGMAHTLKLKESNPKITLNQIPAELELLAEVAKSQGYRTFAVTDNLNIVAEEGFDAGFDRFQNFNYLSAEAVSKKVLEWESEIKKEGKYLLYLNFMDPHYPYHKRAPWFPGTKEGEEVQHVKPNEVAKDGIAAYDSEISYLDHHIKALSDRFSWPENSTIVLIGDHGEEFSEHGRWGHGQTLYQEIVHVPLLIYHPGVAPRRVKENVSSVDLLPTIREMLGADVDPKLSGISLANHLAHDHKSDSRALYAHLQRRGTGEEIKLTVESIVRDEWKLIRSSRKKSPELYNLRSDQKEKQNLFGVNKPKAEALLAELEKYLLDSPKYAGKQVQLNLDEEALKQLESLGYLN